MTTIDEGTKSIKETAAAEGGLAQVTLGELRDELGYRKLGPGVLEEIREDLATTNIGYFPVERLEYDSEDPPRYWQTVWVYLRDGGKRAQVIDAVLKPDASDVRGALDGIAGGQTDLMSDEQKLRAIRALVAE